MTLLGVHIRTSLYEVIPLQFSHSGIYYFMFIIIIVLVKLWLPCIDVLYYTVLVKVSAFVATSVNSQIKFSLHLEYMILFYDLRDLYGHIFFLNNF